MEFQVKTQADGDIINITPRVNEILQDQEIKEGVVLIFVKSTTSSIFIAEDEQGIKKDLLSWVKEHIPKEASYEHDKKWGDGNGFAHLREEVFGCSQLVPIKKGKLNLGTWQNIFLVNWDNKERTREVVIKSFRG